MEGVVPDSASRDETQHNDENNADQHHDSGAQDSLHPTPHDSPQLSPVAGEEDGSSRPPAPLQKRRRVTRACDECRRKKIKCDGKQPCTHCTVYGYECTYDQPSNRRRNTAPQYIEALEKQLARANAILKTVLPGADLNDPTLEAKLQQGIFAVSPAVSSPPNNSVPGPAPFSPEPNGEIPVTDAQLESMVRSTGQLDLDEQGHLEYHGHSSGLSFVKRMREQLGDMMGPEGRGTPFVKTTRPLSQVFDSPRSAHDSPWDNGLDLPPKDEARALCDNAIEDAGALLRVVHYPSFLKQLDAIYEGSHDEYSNEENIFLPLLYSVLALGTLFARDDAGQQELDNKGYETAIAEGFKYFRLARSMMDIADCRDLRQIQALVYMILFLQASAKLSTCYAYIGVALRSAVRMGLHRSFADTTFSPIEAEVRKRLFWVIQRMDTYVGALLGLPHSLSDDDIDQELPAEVDDQYITETGILKQPEGIPALMAAANAHTKLVQILDKIVRYVYPLKATGTTPQGDVKSYSVSYAKILEIERDLKGWQDELPMGLKPGGDAPQHIIRVQHLLRMGYAHAQMMLYRPFLHYVSHTCKSRAIDKRSYACAAACVSVSRNIVHIACEMRRKGLLAGAYWFTMYTAFFAILSLVFYALENPDNDASQDVLRVATEGKETLRKLTKRSMAADRCSATLSALFEQLPNRVRQSRQASLVAKKRKQEATAYGSSTDADMVDHKPPSRASTFPHVRSKSKDLKLPNATNVARSDTMDYAHQNPAHYYELMQQSNDVVATPPLTSGLSQSHESFPASPVDAKDQNFPLADISAVMFPSADPVEYPHQNAAPGAQSYDDILKSLASDPTFPFPTSLNELRMHRAGGAGTFVPPSSTFMHNEGNDQNQMYDVDVQLLGPMPAYMMHNGSFGGQQSGTNSGNGVNTPTDFTSQFLNQSGNQMFTSGGGQNPVNNVNLDQLLSGEEWANLNQNTGYGSIVQNQWSNQNPLANGQPQTTSNPQSVSGKDTSNRTSMEINDRTQFGTKNVSFDDLNPGVLGWNLGGY